LKLARFQSGREIRLGILWGEKIIDLTRGFQLLRDQPGWPEKLSPILDMESFLAHGSAAIRMAGQVEAFAKRKMEGERRVPPVLRGVLIDLNKVRLRPPISNPPKILCLARNYVSHAREVAGDAPLPQTLLVFMKPTTAIIGPGESVIVPPECRLLDHEVELAVVIGKKGRYIPLEKAMDHVVGYTIMNDISDRAYIVQKETQRVNWFFMKAQDTFAPLGPYLMLKDEIKDPHLLRLRLWVNGELRQDSSGEDMIFKIPEIITQISRFVTLEPGDIIATGTPTGTSFSTKKYLQDGDIVECEIEGIGRLKNFIKVEEPIYRKR
jgi:2-keto-4-pentenoate hydratase/2-oxohepta-3-ene-1,7-dioic acid hydratase in catechol pathway